jgi:hypothetical protein
MRRTAALTCLLAVLAGAGCARPVAPAGDGGPANLLSSARWEYSLDGGESWTREVPVARGGRVTGIRGRIRFAAGELSRCVALELTPGIAVGQRQHYYLNGQALRGPVRGMRYETIPLICPKLLRPGPDELTAGISYDNRPPEQYPEKVMPDVPVALARELRALEPRHVRFRTGPVLGAAGPDWFSVTCRTNLPAAVTLTVTGPTAAGIEPRQETSPVGLRHRFRITGLDPKVAWAYHLTASCHGARTQTPLRPVRLLPGGRRLRIVVIADPQSGDGWGAVARAVRRSDADLIVFAGDMVAGGRNDREWDEKFFGVAPELFARIPTYAIVGNHENGSPIYEDLFYTPTPGGRGRNWTQQIAGVRLIGVDGRKDWSAGGANVAWLKRVLAAAAEAKFLFFLDHYPAYSSGKHGKLDEDTGRPEQREVQQARYVLVPLLRQHRATAFMCGHEHVYERSELPGGLTQVTTGGGGHPRRGKVDEAAEQNPHSRTFATGLQYTLIEVDGDSAAMKSLRPDGTVVDTRTWKAR